MANPLVHYDAMCREIALAYEIDEVKQIHDRAVALRHYMRQIKDFDNESRCAKIRLRAERRVAEIYDQETKAKGAQGSGSNQYAVRSHEGTAPTLEEHGFTKQQMSKWRKLTEIPEERFEEEIAKQWMPTVESVYYTVFPPAKPEPVSTEALWLWGRLKEFEREALDTSPNEFFPTMTSHMINDVIDLLPRVIAWLEWTGELCPDRQPIHSSASLSESSKLDAKLPR